MLADAEKLSTFAPALKQSTRSLNHPKEIFLKKSLKKFAD
jgi:hypothetical protein